MHNGSDARQVIVMPGGGLCFGVRRAVDAARSTDEPVAALGALAHNPRIMEVLRSDGVRIIDAPEEIQGDEAVVIRSHGVTPAIKQRLRLRARCVVDATCPRVQRAQRAAKKAAGRGWPVVVVGRVTHPEVEGVVGHAGHDVEVVSRASEARALPHRPRRAVVFQTTFDPSMVNDVLKALEAATDCLEVHDTLCSVVAHRRETVARLAREVQAVVVVGGTESSNTAALAQVVQEAGTPVYCVEGAQDLPVETLQGYKSLAVVGGTSTPMESLEEVAGRLSE